MKRRNPYQLERLVVLAALLASASALALRQALNQKWMFKQSDWNYWLPANVPSTVHLDLLDNNLIKDPYFRAQGKDIYWIEEKDWVYYTTFDISDSSIFKKDNIQLIFHGLDTHADVTLNGRVLFHANNMHRTWVANVKGILAPTNNQLSVYFSSAPLYDITAGLRDHNILLKNMTYSRKAQYQYGKTRSSLSFNCVCMSSKRQIRTPS